MDQQPRNPLQDPTQCARYRLEQDISEQLNGTFDVCDDGTIEESPGKHLSAEQRIVRGKIVASIWHRAGGDTQKEKLAAAIAEYKREAAFTILNRFVALKMLESRGLVQQCVSRGDQSSGFKEFCLLAPGLSMMPDKGYRLYLECLFDELSVEVKVLFDRHDPASLLWPEPKALDDLLNILNAEDLSSLWDVDETIGWVYQYFNSRKEIDDLRDASEAPRNGRELAVRNQFFTPSYVVQFLSDNTLGRTWYEMQRGETTLVEICKYLVRRPTEYFLKPGESPPIVPERPESMPQEEVSKQPVYVPHRPKKDPRDLKILDPACGSGHFLLYCFFLLISIYEEAWNDSGAPSAKEVPGPDGKSPAKTLREDYPTEAMLREAMPGLILRHNLHGIDIDPRCAQIAALALWMRAQRAFNDFAIPRERRPFIRRTNIVVAEPMPGEKDLLKDFTAILQPPLLGDLVRTVFDDMQLAGEAGSLLKIETELRDAISDAKRLWERDKVSGAGAQTRLFGGNSAAEQLKLGLTAISDDTFWHDAEELVVRELRAFIANADSGLAWKRRLFVDDAERGFAFIDLCRHRYDVVLMNPPFGDGSLPSKPYIEETYGDTKGDVFKAFVECFQDRLVPAGLLGIISSRTGFFLSSAQDWRERILLRLFRPNLFADLGYGVLEAKVETAAYTLRALTAEENETLTKSLIPKLQSIPLDAAGYFSVPKYQKVRGLKRHQAVGELDRLVAFGAVRPIPGSFARFGMAAKDRVYDDSRALSHDLRSQVAMFFRLLSDDNKAAALHRIVSSLRDDVLDSQCFVSILSSFRDIPGTPFAYWVGPKIRRLYGSSPIFELPDCRTVKQGLATADDFRFVRLWWEVSPQRLLDANAVVSWRTDLTAFQTNCQALTRSGKCWVAFAKGGEYTPYHADLGFVVNWENCGKEIRNFIDPETGKVCSRPQNSVLFFRPGLSYLSRTSLRLCATPLPAGCIFSHVGPAILPEISSLLQSLARFNSYAVEACISPFHARGMEGDDQTKKYEVGLLQSVPWPPMQSGEETIKNVLSTFQRRTASDETSRSFCLDDWGDDPTAAVTASVMAAETIVAAEYGLRLDDAFSAATGENGASSELSADLENGIRVGLAWPSVDDQIRLRLQYVVGCVFGRWDVRIANGQRTKPDLSDCFDPLSRCSPGMLQGADGLPNSSPPDDYPIIFPPDGVLVDDSGHDRDFIAAIRQGFTVIYGDGAETQWHECEAALGRDVRSWMNRNFADYHRKQYSRPGRKAPIYWQIATPNAGYSVWLYSHRQSQDSLFRAQRLVEDKLEHEQRQFWSQRESAGMNPTASQRKELEQCEAFVAELSTMLEEIKRVAPLWQPNLDDGILLVLAPLWRLFPHQKAWQKELKACWDALAAGGYDWSHLAMHLWPERVVPKCVKDVSLAIAHGLDQVLWEDNHSNGATPEGTSEDEGGSTSAMFEEDMKPKGKKQANRAKRIPRWTPRPAVNKKEISQLVAERTNPVVKSALQSLLDAPMPGGESMRKAKTKPPRRAKTEKSQTTMEPLF